jgi:hypothetical protein
LKWTSNGLGVFARHDMKIVRQEVGEGYGHDTGLHANYQGLVEGINWSIGMVTINKSTVGRPKNIETGRRKSSDRIRNNTLGLISKSLVGPFNFINHACDECAQLEWEENAVKNSIHVTAKKGKRIKKYDEVFINHKGVKCEEGDVFPCGMCSKSTAASSTASTAASTAAVSASSTAYTATISAPSTAASTAAASSIFTSTATPSSTNDMEIDDETAELNKINAEVNAMIIKATSKQRKKKKKKTASSSTVAVSTANNNEQDIDVMEDAGCIEVSDAIAAAANAATITATITAIASHGLKNNKRGSRSRREGGGGKSSAGCGIGSDDSSVDSNSSGSVIDLDALRSTTDTTTTLK